jgi:queuine tRNA-ribosyltransferase
MVHEPSAPRLLTLHNVAWLLRLVERIRHAIAGAVLDDLRSELAEVWPERESSMLVRRLS